jgi:hypothetical protein
LIQLAGQPAVGRRSSGVAAQIARQLPRVQKKKKQKIKSPGLWGAEALLQALRGCIPGQRKRHRGKP